MLMRACRLLGNIHGSATIIEIVYALDIKFLVRWCTCSMWRMLLPCDIIDRSVVVLSPLSHFYFVFET